LRNWPRRSGGGEMKDEAETWCDLLDMRRRQAGEAYENENKLQELVATHPYLLGGNQIDPEDERRWLLVRREQTINDAATKMGRWSLDHLFLDQDGIPTFVEVKRASDTRIWREVVGQMLEYAANASAYWSAHHIRDALASSESDTEAVVEEFAKRDSAAFWKDVQINLDSRLIRLIFMADCISHELRRIVEFLNEQMETEVLAVEIRKYATDGKQVYVPRVIGATAKARDRKFGGAIKYFDEIKNLCSVNADNIVVGFMGGIKELEGTSIKLLEERRYKWDWANNETGSRNPAN